MPYNRPYPARTAKRTYRKKYTKPKPALASMTQTKKLIKNIVLKTSESKYKSMSIGKVELYHNVLNNLSKSFVDTFPAQGDTDASRDGDEIYIQGWKLRLMFGQKADRPNVTFRCFVVKYQNQLSGLATTYGNFFHNITGNGLLDPVQYKRFNILKSFIIKSSGTSMEVGETAKEYVKTKSLWVPLKRKLKFADDTSTTAVNINQDISLIVLAYDAYGSLITDNIGYVQGSVTLYYKDP